MFFVYDTLIVREGHKTILSMIGTHAAFSKSSEAHFTCGEMNDGIVDASSAEAAAGGKLSGCLSVAGKEIKGKGMCH